MSNLDDIIVNQYYILKEKNEDTDVCNIEIVTTALNILHKRAEIEEKRLSIYNKNKELIEKIGPDYQIYSKELNEYEDKATFYLKLINDKRIQIENLREICPHVYKGKNIIHEIGCKLNCTRGLICTVCECKYCNCYICNR